MDEQIAAEPPVSWPEVAPGAKALPVEAFLAARHRPIAVVGVVQNGVVRPLDPTVHLPEQARVIIVATERF
jgi:hypothetical protein